MALSEDILKLKDAFNGANPLQAGMNQAGGTLQLPNVQDIQAPQVAAPQPLTNAIPEPSVAESIAAPQFDPNQFFGERVGNQPVGLADVAASGQLRQPAGTQKFEPTSLGGVPTGLTPSTAMESGNFDPAQANAINPFDDTTGRGGLPQPYLKSTAGQVAPPEQGVAPSVVPGAPTVSSALSAPTGLGLRTDPQGRMIPAGSETRADAFSDFERQSALREQRAAESFGQARGPDSRDRDRRGTMSKADAVKLTGGDRAAADALLKRQELGLGEFAPEKAGQTGLTPEQDLAERKFELDKAKFVDSVIAREGASAPLSPAQKKFAEEAGKGAYEWDQGGRAGAQENINKFQTVLTDLEDGNLDTRTLTEFAPFIGDWARAAINPTGQQGLDTIRGVIFQGLRDTLGAQFTEREGERLVSASYNPKLDEASNIARLKPALDRMKATFAAKEALTQHIMQGGSVQDYKGITPMEAYQGKGQPQGSSAQSPIEGDVDVASEADKILSSL